MILKARSPPILKNNQLIKRRERKMNKILQIAATIFSLMTIVAAFLITPITALAANVTDESVTNYTSTWNLRLFNGLHWTDNAVWMKKVDGIAAFCIEHGVDLTPGSGFEPSELSIAEKDKLSLMAYYGYQTNPTASNYAVVQHMVWEELGDKLLTTNVPNYAGLKSEILSKVSRHNAKPSFNEQTVELNVGDSVTLTDSAGVLSKYQHLVENSASLQVEKNGNTLKLTAKADSKETGKIRYNIASNENIGQSFVYQKGSQQKVATFKLANGGSFNINVKVNLNGHVKAKKIDQDTGQALPNAKLKFEYAGQTKEIVTDGNGIAQVNDIKAGTKH